MKEIHCKVNIFFNNIKFDYIKKFKSTKIRRTAQQKLKWRKKIKIGVCTLEQRIYYLFYISN